MKKKYLYIIIVVGVVTAAVVFGVMYFRKHQSVPAEKTEGFHASSEKTSTPTLVFFHANWCGHCQSMKGEWEKTKQGLAGSNIATLDLEDSKNPGLAKNNDVKGFPTIRLYKSGFPGQYKEYVGERTSNKLVEFAKTNS